MTDKQQRALLKAARKELFLTTQGHVQYVEDGSKGGHWKKADALLDQLDKSFTPTVKIPALGPIWHNGKSVLLHDLTHATSGIKLFPAFDDAFSVGTVIIAPEAITVIPNPVTGAPWSSSNPGKAFYAKGISKLRYWFGHLDRNHPVGTKFKKGDAIGKVCVNNIGGGPHCHMGLNIELLLGEGKQLIHHTNYTHGAPLIGAQLRKALADAA